MKQGPFPHRRLCCPTGSRSTTTPSDCLSATCHFPAPPVIGRPCFPGRRPGAEEALSSSQDNPPTVPRPLRREALGRPLQIPRRLPWPSPSKARARLLLGPAHAG